MTQDISPAAVCLRLLVLHACLNQQAVYFAANLYKQLLEAVPLPLSATWGCGWWQLQQLCPTVFHTYSIWLESDGTVPLFSNRPHVTHWQHYTASLKRR